MTLVAGWYGKIPSLGDFASRRLPTNFISTWDAWLQDSITASRRLLADRWLDVYLRAPMWRFALMPGVCGERAWAGVLMPSVDKVGRHFPLTLALPLEAESHGELMVTVSMEAQAWYGELEKLAPSALGIDFSADDLERGLAEIPFP